MKKIETPTKNNPYHSMWIIAFFDLPTLTKEDRRNYREFRKQLLKWGFLQLQLSVYGKYMGDEKRGERIKTFIKSYIPEKGEVRFLTITDIQFGKMEVYYEKKRKKPEEKQDQLLLF